ncbi:MAG TPA: FliA/WhiG family RNA polymerase sigma factor [Bacilli bacterium]|nr:FliA/WhiG family RNA polymerase sigma factor [Bacilli bacterium]
MQELMQSEPGVLWTRWQQEPTKETRDSLVLAYLPLVHKIVRKMTSGWSRTFSQEDLVGMGTLGLMEAVERFDPSKGYEFVTFATWRIRGAVLDGLRNLDWVPRSLREKAKQIETAYAFLEHAHLRSVSDEEVAEYLGQNVHEFQQVVHELSISPLVSLDGLVQSEEGDSEVRLFDRIVDPDAPLPDVQLEKQNVRDILTGVLDRLPDKERLVITLHYYEEFTFKEIAEILELSCSRVSQLHTKAIYRLRGALSRRKKELRT